MKWYWWAAAGVAAVVGAIYLAKPKATVAVRRAAPAGSSGFVWPVNLYGASPTWSPQHD